MQTGCHRANDERVSKRPIFMAINLRIRSNINAAHCIDGIRIHMQFTISKYHILDPAASDST